MMQDMTPLNASPLNAKPKRGNLGLIGCGLMGHGIAKNLLTAGHRVTILSHPGNQPCDDLAALGAGFSASMADIAHAKDAVLLVLPGSPEVDAVMLSAGGLMQHLETGTLVIPDTGEEIHSAPGVAVVVCSNTEGGADESGLFAGSQAQNGATRSRFAYISLDYPEPEQERQILLSRVPDIDSISTIGDKPFSALAIELGTACRALVNEGAVSLPYTVRNMLRFGQSTKELHDYSDGFRDAYFDGLSPSEQVPVDEVFKKYFGVHLLPQPENNSTA